MRKKHTYKAEAVERVRIEELLPLLAAGCIVALDVAKQKFVAALATLAGEVVKLFRFEHPTETHKFLSIVAALRAGVERGKLKVAMEPTGTYGDAIRHQLVKEDVAVWMVSPKRTHDSQELFDGVRSLHDPKSAVLVAKLCAMNLATQWQPPEPTRRQLRALTELRGHEQGNEERCYGRLEAALARHWPEFGRRMDVRSQKSALRLLSAYPSPAHVWANPDAIVSFLQKASRGNLSTELVQGLIADAKESLGVPMVDEEEHYVRRLATEALEMRQHIDQIEVQMSEHAQDDAVLVRLMAWMGVFTATVIITFCDPRQYATARQLEKACGLNLREKSSGEHVGRLSITKRGPGLVRKVLYLFALRMIHGSSVCRAWYKRRRGYTEDSKQRAVVAVMRKLVRAIFHVAKGNEFDERKLFDVRRLDLEGDEAKRKLEANEVQSTPLEAEEAKRKLEADEVRSTQFKIAEAKRTGLEGGAASHSKRLPFAVPPRGLLASIEAAHQAQERLARADTRTRQRTGKDLQAPTEPRPTGRGTKRKRAANGVRAST
jgi:transposase